MFNLNSMPEHVAYSLIKQVFLRNYKPIAGPWEQHPKIDLKWVRRMPDFDTVASEVMIDTGVREQYTDEQGKTAFRNSPSNEKTHWEIPHFVSPGNSHSEATSYGTEEETSAAFAYADEELLRRGFRLVGGIPDPCPNFKELLMAILKNNGTSI